MSVIKAMKKISLEEQLIKYGYFSEEMPDCFSSEDLYNEYETLKHYAKKGEWSECCTYTIAKKNHARRVMKIPNPEQQVMLIDYLMNNKKAIGDFINKSKNTQSNPFQVYNYEDTDIAILDIPRLKNSFRLPSSYVDGILEKIRASMGYKYKLKLDLSNFYDSIYTHTLEWVTKGRETAKKELRSQNKTKDLGKDLDKFVRKTNSNETSGIPTGPFTSRIISEFLLVKIDTELSKQGYKFKRYVDDYEFYFKSEDEIINKKEMLNQIFHNYRLQINEQKTEIIKYPYNNNVGINKIYSYYLKKLRTEVNDKNCRMIIVSLFSKADEFYKNGSKGAYKYLFKMLVNVDFKNTWDEVEAFIINTILIIPSLTRFAALIVLNNFNKITDDFKSELFENLKDSCTRKYDNEAQWLFWLLMKMGYEFKVADLEFLLKNSEDTILNIMIIYYADKHKPNSIILQKLIKKYYQKLSQFSIYSEYWLTVYECYVNKWFDYYIFESVINKSAFFVELNKRKVHFFKI